MSALLGYYTSHSAPAPAKHISLAELAKDAQAPTVAANGVHPAEATKAQRNKLKAQAALITPFDGNGKTKDAAQQASYAVVVQDHDDDNKSESDIRAIYAALKVPYLAFTTSSHTDDAPRWKVLIPLADPCNAEQHGIISRGLAQSLGTDTAQARTQQGFYAPHKLIDDAPYSFIDELDSYPPVDIKDTAHPFTAEVMQGWAELEAIEAQENKQAQAAPAKALQPSNTEGAGIIGKISEYFSHDLRGVLQQHGYKGNVGKMLRPYSSSGAPAVRLFNEGTPEVRCYSHHGADDPLSASNHNGHALDLPAAICALDFNNDIEAMVKHYAPLVDAEGQKHRQREYAKEQDRLKTEELFIYDHNGVQLFTHHEDGTVSPAMRSTEPAAPLEPRQHPLSITVDLAAEVMPPKWIIPNFIAEGIALIAGGHGVGKTTALLPLAMAAAGIHETDYPLAPKHWRHVVYITEDVNQAKLIINGYMRAIGGDHAELVERVHIVEALRMPPSYVVAIGDHYRENYTRTVSTAAGEVKLPPLVVIDTMAATFQLENENDNAEASTLIAALKQQFRLPLWIVGHVSKGDLSKDGLNGLNPSLRGASAFEADANQVLYLTKERDDSRWLVRGKSRFESPWYELQIETDSQTYLVQNQFGDYEQLTQRWGIARPQDKSRTEIAKEQQAAEQQRADDDKKKELIDHAKRAEDKGAPLSKTELKGEVSGNGQKNFRLIDDLLDEGWLYEVAVPVEQRTHHKRTHYIVSLGLGERDEYLATGTPPAHKLEVPDTWKKAIKEKTPI